MDSRPGSGFPKRRRQKTRRQMPPNSDVGWSLLVRSTCRGIGQSVDKRRLIIDQPADGDIIVPDAGIVCRQSFAPSTCRPIYSEVASWFECFALQDHGERNQARRDASWRRQHRPSCAIVALDWTGCGGAKSEDLENGSRECDSRMLCRSKPPLPGL